MVIYSCCCCCFNLCRKETRRHHVEKNLLGFFVCFFFFRTVLQLLYVTLPDKCKQIILHHIRRFAEIRNKISLNSVRKHSRNTKKAYPRPSNVAKVSSLVKDRISRLPQNQGKQRRESSSKEADEIFKHFEDSTFAYTCTLFSYDKVATTTSRPVL